MLLIRFPIKQDTRLKMYFQIRKIQLRVSKSPDDIKYIQMTALKTIAAKAEQLLVHATELIIFDLKYYF